MVIGGAEIYALALPHVAQIYLTQVHATPNGDTHFPDLQAADWRELGREDHAPEGDTPGYSFVTLERVTGEKSG